MPVLLHADQLTWPWTIITDQATPGRGPAGYYPPSLALPPAGKVWWLFYWTYPFGLYDAYRPGYPPALPPWPADSFPDGFPAATAAAVTQAVTGALTSLEHGAVLTPPATTTNGEPDMAFPDGKLVSAGLISSDPGGVAGVYYGGLPATAYDRQLVRYKNFLASVGAALQRQADLAQVVVNWFTSGLAAGSASPTDPYGLWLLGLDCTVCTLRNVLADRAAEAARLAGKYSNFNISAPSAVLAPPQTAAQDMASDMFFQTRRLTALVNDGVMALTAWCAAAGSTMPLDLQANWNLLDYHDLDWLIVLTETEQWL